MKLDTLEECDGGDELYAEFALNPQEISIAGVPSFKALLLPVSAESVYFMFTSAAAVCIVGLNDRLPDNEKRKDVQFVGIALAATSGFGIIANNMMRNLGVFSRLAFKGLPLAGIVSAAAYFGCREVSIPL